METFLFSLKPLDHLHVLLEGNHEGTFELGKVLRIHGKCLQSFIWNERTGPRSDVPEDTAEFPDNYEDLELIAKHCPALKALGIAIDWKDIAASEKDHKVKAVAALGCAFTFMLISLRLLPHSLDWVNFRLCMYEIYQRQRHLKLDFPAQ